MRWSTIPEFNNYEVSDGGQVRNKDTGRIMGLTQNQNGVVQVGMMRNRCQYRRGVALLVASAFLDPPPNDAYNTPINLDGVRTHNHVDNLAWRPRWFAVKYHQQFHNGKRGFDNPIRDTKTGEVFPTSWDAAMKYGLLDREIMIATLNRTYVFPTFQEFELVEE